ncbi:hypothetical protein FOZ62_026648, partial [Perkinsus olseni]
MGILNGRMGCSHECRVLSGWRCDAGGCASVCGDGIRVEGEACDLGYECSPDNLCQPLCGNGVVDVDEECDDGGRLDGDGCDHDCVVEPWYACSKSENSRGASFCDYQPVRVHCQADCSADWTTFLFSWRAVMTAMRSITNTTTFVVHLADTVEDAIVTWSPGMVAAAACLVLNTTGERFCPGDRPLVITSSVSLRFDKDTHDEFQSGWGFEIAKRECGDGRRHFEEACDDGNSLSGDGCDAACHVEEGFVCFGGGYYNGDACVYQRDDAVTSGCRKIQLPYLSPSLEPCTGLLTVSDHTMTNRKRMVLDFQLPDNDTVAVVDLHHLRPAVMVFDRTTHPEYIALNVSMTPLAVHRRGMVESRRVSNYPEGQLLSNTTVVRDGLKFFPVNLTSCLGHWKDKDCPDFKVGYCAREKAARLFLYTAICGDGHRTEPFEVCDDANTDSDDGCDYPTCTPSTTISSGTRHGYVCSGGTFTTRDYCSVSFIFIDCPVGCSDFGMESHSGVHAVARLRTGKLTFLRVFNNCDGIPTGKGPSGVRGLLLQIQVEAEAVLHVIPLATTTTEQQNCTVSAEVAGLRPSNNLTFSSSPPIYLPPGDHALALERMLEGLYKSVTFEVGSARSSVSGLKLALRAVVTELLKDMAKSATLEDLTPRTEFANVTTVLRVATEDVTHVLIVEQCNLEEVSLTRRGWDAQLCFPQEQALVQWNYTGMFYLTPSSPAARLNLLIYRVQTVYLSRSSKPRGRVLEVYKDDAGGQELSFVKYSRDTAASFSKKNSGSMRMTVETSGSEAAIAELPVFAKIIRERMAVSANAPQICGDGIHVLGEECDGSSLGCSSKDCTVEPSYACIGSSYGARRSRCMPINMDGSIHCEHRSCRSLSIEQGPLNGSLLVGRSGSVSAFEKAHIQPTAGIGWQCGVGRLDLFGDALVGSGTAHSECRPESSRYLSGIETDEGIERDPLAWRVIDSGKKQDLIIKWSTVG